MEAPPGRLGRCQGAFWMALLFDAASLAILLVGVFMDVYFSDLLIYGGGVGIFFSLVWWVFWYVGNLEVPPEELQDDVGLEGKARPGEEGQGSLVGSFVRSVTRVQVSIRSRGGGSGKQAATTSSSSSSINNSNNNNNNHPLELQPA